MELARHERTFGSPPGESKVSRMVPLRGSAKGWNISSTGMAGGDAQVRGLQLYAVGEIEKAECPGQQRSGDRDGLSAFGYIV
jgi:hypothetical protein